MGCDMSHLAHAPSHLGFNPRTHMGCDAQETSPFVTEICFNPRTHMGCDSGWVTSISEIFLFQSTHPHGVRREECLRQSIRIRVSIHAPTWGATAIFKSVTFPLWFQSTHPHGVRPNVIQVDTQVNTFQSTHPHGVRHKDGQ